MKNFVYFLITATFTGSLLASLPDDKIPTMNEQIDLYRKAYAPFNHKEFDPEKTHIEGLVPMVRIAHSYAVQGIPQNDERFEILKSLWKETEQQIEKKNITVSYFLKMNMRLAFLFSHNKKMSLISEKAPQLKKIKISTNKWDIENYKDIASNPYPFCFEAILYHAEEIPVRTFLDNYLNLEFPMGLSTLPHYIGSEFEEEQPDPVTFLMLDLLKSEHLSRISGKNSVYWPTFRNVFRKIYTTDDSSFATTGLFLFLNEFILQDGDIITSPKETIQTHNIDKKLENDLPENLPLCERLYFKRLLWEGEETIVRLGNPLHLQLDTIFESLKSQEYPHLSLGSESVKKIDRETFEGTIETILLIPESMYSSWEIASKMPEMIIKLGGSIKSIFKVQATDNSNKEKITFGEVSFEEKNDLEEVTFNNTIHFISTKTSEEDLKRISEHYKIPYTFENIKNEAIELLKNKESITHSRKVLFNIMGSDICNFLNILNNTDKLSHESSTEEITESYKSFINLFYSKYKDLFSTEEIKVLEDK